jgi:short subunit dehydrogenase-like uncharacterized protein
LAPSSHDLSLVDFTINIAESNFRHTQGYGSTSKMIAESALCLVRDVQGEGGTWTPGALMGPALRKRLKERAGLTFSAR